MSFDVGKINLFRPVQSGEQVVGGGRAKGVQPGTEVGAGGNPLASSNTSQTLGLAQRDVGASYYSQNMAGYDFANKPSRILGYA